MRRAHWSIAAAKAELSSVVRRSKREPQILENRGKPVAVVVGIDEYRRTSEREVKKAGWNDFLVRTDAMVADGGGFELGLPPRTTRPSPFERPPRRGKAR